MHSITFAASGLSGPDVMEIYMRRFLTHSLGAMMRRLTTMPARRFIAWSLALALAFFPAASAQL